MELEFDTLFKHPWSMIATGPSNSGITVFTKQVLNKSDKQFGSIPNGKTDTKFPGIKLRGGHAILAGRVPRIQCAKSNLL